MTAEQIQQWKVERDIARRAKNPELLQTAYDHRDDMMMECIQHQADRVKLGLQNDAEMASEIRDIKTELKPLKATEREYREDKLKAQGMIILWRILRYLAAGGMGAAVLQVLKGGAQ